MGDDEDGPSRALVALLQPLCSDAWVQCDHCELWRRVPKEVSERLGDDEQWCAPLSRSEHFASFPPTRSDVFAPSDARPARGPTVARLLSFPGPVSFGPDRRDRGAAPRPRRACAPRAPRPPPRPRADSRDLSAVSERLLLSRANAKPQTALSATLRASLRRFCKLNNDSRYDTCEAPQEIDNDEIDILLKAQQDAEEQGRGDAMVPGLPSRRRRAPGRLEREEEDF